MENTPAISIETIVNAPIDKVWKYWTQAEHIVKWNAASDDWHTTKAENDIQTGGEFSFRMEAKDGSFGFDFGGVYDEVRPNEYLAYTLGDGRPVEVFFTVQDGAVKIEESFEPESVNPVEMQQAGWQAILDNFKKYTESN